MKIIEHKNSRKDMLDFESTGSLATNSNSKNLNSSALSKTYMSNKINGIISNASLKDH